jgi:hypothetical protein
LPGSLKTRLFLGPVEGFIASGFWPSYQRSLDGVGRFQNEAGVVEPDCWFGVPVIVWLVVVKKCFEILVLALHLSLAGKIQVFG